MKRCETCGILLHGNGTRCSVCTRKMQAMRFKYNELRQVFEEYGYKIKSFDEYMEENKDEFSK